jgi:hypothetical protein
VSLATIPDSNPQPTEITDLSQLPKSMLLGDELSLTYQTGHPDYSDPPYEYKVIAGSYLHLPVIGQSVSPTLLQALQQQLEATKTTLASGDDTLIATLTREDILGDLFYAGGLGYFAQYMGMAHVLALPQRATHQLAFGYGSYGYEPHVSRFFGFPRAIEAGGAVMNIRIARQLGTHETDAEQLKTLNLQSGLLSSALEHAVPEQMFVTAQNPGEAISAVKALAKASAAGQRVYHLTPANQTTTLSQIHQDGDTMTEIRAALAAGLEIITHTEAVSVPGWSGAGYIILDPETGSGAYKIGGGANGGFAVLLTGVSQGAATMAMILAVFAATPLGLTAVMAVTILVLFVLLPPFLIAVAYADTVFQHDKEQACLDVGGSVGILLAGLGAAMYAGTYKVLESIFTIVATTLLFDSHKDIAECVQT